MSWFMVDVEADGPIPGDYSMVELGVVVVRRGTILDTFHGKLRPLPGAKWLDDALKVVGYSHEHTETFDDPLLVMQQFEEWVRRVNQGNRPMFVSDNNGFDWGFVNWYLHHFLGRNPFGHSSTNLGSLYKGIVRDFSQNFKHLRRTKHTHNPVDDAMGNAEAMLHMVDNMRLKMSGVE